MQQTTSINGYRGSLTNLIYSNNRTQPIVGNPATIMHYTDRSVVHIASVSKDGKTCTTTSGATYTYRQGSWRQVGEYIDFTKEFLAICGDKFAFQVLTQEQQDAIWEGKPYPQNVIEGITCLKKSYSKISIVFNVADEYFDPHF
jgi:hypothetical protein